MCVGKVERLGTYSFDLTDLRSHHIKETNKDASKRNLHKKQQDFTVTVMIMIEIIDRDLNFSVHWPAKENAPVVRNSRHKFSIAGGFEPGTK
jgi:hypothetical protein